MHAAPIELKLEMPPPPHVVVNMVEPAAQPPAVHDPLTHVEPAAQGVPQPPQLLASLAKSTHAPLQSIGAIVGQPDAHEYEAVAPTHTGVLPLQPLPQVPQLLEVVS